MYFNKVLLQLFLVCLSVLQNLTASNAMFEWKSNPAYENVTSDADRIRTVNGASTLQCSLQCLDTTDCVAFFHSRRSQVCHLQSSATLHPINLTSSADTQFYPNVCMKHDFKYHADLRKYYAILWQPLTKSDAELQCKHHGGRLIRLDRKSELSAMKNILQAISTISLSNEAFWVGAEVHVNKTSSHFEWNNGIKVDSSFWVKGQPQYNAAGNVLTGCVLIMPYLGYNLDDYECIPSSGLRIFPICECALP